MFMKRWEEKTAVSQISSFEITNEYIFLLKIVRNSGRKLQFVPNRTDSTSDISVTDWLAVLMDIFLAEHWFHLQF